MTDSKNSKTAVCKHFNVELFFNENCHHIHSKVSIFVLSVDVEVKVGQVSFPSGCLCLNFVFICLPRILYHLISLNPDGLRCGALRLVFSLRFDWFF